ncbi:MAG: shikimate kinase [Alphaproteobacteria bacterium]
MDGLIKKIRECLDQPIALVGMMGCGKSHVGSALASYLDIPFYDSDAEVVMEQECSIQEIFDEYGEAHFRELEVQKIASLMKSDKPCVISTGGGALVRPETLQLIQERAISIWIECDVDTIYERVKDDTGRPLLQSDDPRGVLVSLLEQREALYKQADIRVDNKARSIEETLRTIGQEVLPRL